MLFKTLILECLWLQNFLDYAIEMYKTMHYQAYSNIAHFVSDSTYEIWSTWFDWPPNVICGRSCLLHFQSLSKKRIYQCERDLYVDNKMLF
jgi:hypothetical protein